MSQIRNTARKPIALRPSRQLQGEPAIWAGIRDLGTFTLHKLRDDCGQDRGRINRYVRRLVAGGYVTAEKNQTYKLIKDVGVDYPRLRDDGSKVVLGGARQSAWNSMRILGAFSAVDIAAHRGITETHASHYLSCLAGAGILKKVRKSRHGVKSRYVLLPHANTGPKAPGLGHSGKVSDPNTGLTHTPGDLK